MSRRQSYLISAAVATLAIGFALVLAGCGQKQAATSSVPPPSARGQNVAATGPAISEKLTFDQLALDSPVKRVVSASGPVYLQFAYTDLDGKVYKCNLPEAMSKGQYQQDEWVRTFNVYRLPEVIKQKKVAKKSTDEVADFPFISPRAAAPSEQSQGGTVHQPAPAPQPSITPMPAPPPPAAATPPPGGGRISSGPMEDMPVLRPNAGAKGGLRPPGRRDTD